MSCARGRARVCSGPQDGHHAGAYTCKLKWLLQILDTHVFAQLKRQMRRLLWAGRNENVDGSLSVSMCLKALTQATSNIVVNRSWQHLLGRVGLDGSVDALRPGLRDLVQGADLSPRKPSIEELAEVLGAHRKHVGVLHCLLFADRSSVGETAAGGSALGAATQATDDQEAENFLAPWQPAARSMPEHSGPADVAAAPSVTSRTYPRGRRLLPCVRNLRILPPPSIPAADRMPTRSQRPVLVAGVVGEAKRRRTLQQHEVSGS